MKVSYIVAYALWIVGTNIICVTNANNENESVSEKRTPRAKKALIKLLNEASEKAKEDKERAEIKDEVIEADAEQATVF